MKRKTTPKKQEEAPKGDTPGNLRIGGESGKDVELKNFVIEEDEAGNPSKVNFTVDAKGALRLKLIMYSMNTENPEMREQLDELVKILDDHVEKLIYRLEDDGRIWFDGDLREVVVGEHMTEEQSKEQTHTNFQKLMNHPAVGLAVHELNGKQNEFLERVQEAEQRAREAEKQLKEAEKQLKAKTGKYRRSGHLSDQILKYPKKDQPSIFDSLNEQTKEALQGAKVDRTEVVEGIRLSPSQQKVVDSLCKLLHEESQNSDPKEDNYYSGNAKYNLIPYGEDKQTIAPKIAFTLYQLALEYKGGNTPTGRDLENVRKTLVELDEIKFLLRYVEVIPLKGERTREIKIEGYHKLIFINTVSDTIYNGTDIEATRSDMVVSLNPIFRRQIESKFILYPNDITKRTIMAYGSLKVSEATLRLRDYLMRELTYKRVAPTISLENLYYLLAAKYMKESRKALVKKDTIKALEACKTLGLLLSYDIKPGKTGEQIVYFNINKNWE